jgi:hypothetical protein
MSMPFDIKGILRDRDALVARLELAFALERRPLTTAAVAPEPLPAERRAKDPKRR